MKKKVVGLITVSSLECLKATGLTSTEKSCHGDSLSSVEALMAVSLTSFEEGCNGNLLIIIGGFNSLWSLVSP